MIDPSASPPPSALRGGGGSRLLVALVLLAIAGGVGFWIYRSSGSPQPDTVAIPAIDAGGGEADLGELNGLPPIDLSDAFVRERLAPLSRDPLIQHALETPGLARRLVALVSALADGETPRSTVGLPRPEGTFLVEERGGRTFLSTRGYARYDAMGRAIASIDPALAAGAFHALRPLCTRVWREIAPPNSRFDEAIDTALRRVAETKSTEGDLLLTPKGGVWAFADPTLEGLPPLDKQLLRMGPVNAAKVREKAQELRSLLKGDGGN